MDEAGQEQRDLFRRWPAGVSVVVAELDGRRAGLTVSSLLSLSLEPPLVGFSLARSSTLYEVLDDAGEWGVSILAGDQEHVAGRFASNAPPLVMWDGVSVRPDDNRLIEGAVGWITAETVASHVVGDHVIFVGSVRSLEEGPGQGSLVYYDRRYVAL